MTAVSIYKSSATDENCSFKSCQVHAGSNEDMYSVAVLNLVILMKEPFQHLDRIFICDGLRVKLGGKYYSRLHRLFPFGAASLDIRIPERPVLMCIHNT